MLTGGQFERLLIFPGGSGVAVSLVPADASGLTNALISASGPLGPAIAGSLLIVVSRTEGATRAALTVVGSALLLLNIDLGKVPDRLLVLPALGMGALCSPYEDRQGSSVLASSSLALRRVSA
jgi:hypothetical protein